MKSAIGVLQHEGLWSGTKVYSFEAVGERHETIGGHPEAFGEAPDAKVFGPEAFGERLEAAGGAWEAMAGWGYGFKHPQRINLEVRIK